MSSTGTKTTRRHFFVRGGAVLGTGVATAAASPLLGGAAPSPQEQLQALQRQAADALERETLRELQRSFAALMERGAYAAAASLFAEHGELQLSGGNARGQRAIRALLTRQYPEQRAPTLHAAYRANARQAEDSITVSQDGLRAEVTAHVDVALVTPLQGDFTIARMARLQGQVADRRWESGRLEIAYAKAGGAWQIASLRYRAA